jgi:hypothetical protein
LCFIALYRTEGAMRIISRKTAAARADVNARTLDRLHTLGLGPPRIQLSRRRVGYEDEAFDDWLRSRAFTSMAAAHAVRVPVDPAATTVAQEPPQIGPQAVTNRSSALPAATKPVRRVRRLRASVRRKDTGPQQNPLPSP